MIVDVIHVQRRRVGGQHRRAELALQGQRVAGPGDRGQPGPQRAQAGEPADPGEDPGLGRDQVLGYWRGKKQDIKRVWTSGRWDEHSKKTTGKWEYEISKVRLAGALWPTLEQKIEQLKVSDDAPVPPIVQVISDAYHLAQQWRYLSFVLTEAPDAQDS